MLIFNVVEKKLVLAVLFFRSKCIKHTPAGAETNNPNVKTILLINKNPICMIQSSWLRSVGWFRDKKEQTDIEKSKKSNPVQLWAWGGSRTTAKTEASLSS